MKILALSFGILGTALVGGGAFKLFLWGWKNSIFLGLTPFEMYAEIVLDGAYGVLLLKISGAIAGALEPRP